MLQLLHHKFTINSHVILVVLNDVHIKSQIFTLKCGQLQNIHSRSNLYTYLYVHNDTNTLNSDLGCYLISHFPMDALISMFYYPMYSIVSHFYKIDLMPVISCLTSLTFWSLFHVISIPFGPKTRLGPKFVKK